MENARIFLVEDCPLIREFFVEWMETSSNHRVVLTTSTLEEALSVIRNGKLQALDVNISVVDGNLKEKSSTCEDGRMVAKAIKDSVVGNIVVIAHSGCPEEVANYGDYYVPKDTNISVMLDLIKRLSA